MDLTLPKRKSSKWRLLTEGVILLILWPIGALISAFRWFRNDQAKNVFWFFCVFMGAVYIYDPAGKSNADGVSYAKKLIELHNNPMTWEIFKESFYDPIGGFLDFYQPTITFMVSSFTENPSVLFMIFAFVFGFFYSRNMWFVLEKIPIKINIPLFVLISTLFLVNPIWNINGVRMWTACQVFVYGVLPFIWNKDKSKLIWVFVSYFIHFSFFIPILIFLVYLILPKRNILPFIILYIISLFISELDMESVRSIGNLLPELFHRKVLGYTSDMYVQEISEVEVGLLIKVLGYISKWGLAVILTIIALKDRVVLRTNVSLQNAFSFSLFILSISNVLDNIPSGGRFVTVSKMFVFAFIIVYYTYLRMNYPSRFSFNVISLVSYFLILTLFIPIRVPTVFYGPVLFTNPIIALFFENKESIYYLIKGI